MFSKNHIRIFLLRQLYLKAENSDVILILEVFNKTTRTTPNWIANAENGNASVSIELLIRAMLATGATPQEIGQVIAQVG